MCISCNQSCEEERNSCITDSIEEVEEQHAAEQNPPRTVVEERTEVVLHAGSLFHGLHMFAGHEEGKDEKYGARPLKRAMQTKVEDALTDEILSGNVKAGDTVAVGVAGKKCVFHVKH